MRIRKAVIPAAGLGTRFLPATKTVPKEMLPIIDKPTLQYIVEEAVESGIESILIVIGRNKTSIEDHFDRSPELEFELERKGNTEMLDMVRSVSSLANIHFIRQKEAKGLGHAVACARVFTGREAFALLLGDDIIDAKKSATSQLIDVFNETRSSVLGVQKVPRNQVSKYGIIKYSKEFKNSYVKVDDVVEKPSLDNAPSEHAIVGRYILTPQIFDALALTKPGVGGEIQLTDAIKSLMKEDEVFACEFIGRRYDAGDKIGYLQAAIELAMKHPEIGEQFLDYLSDVALDDDFPLHTRIGQKIKSKRTS